MFCGKCGAQIPEDSVFCKECGTPINSEKVLNYEWKNVGANTMLLNPAKNNRNWNTGIAILVCMALILGIIFFCSISLNTSKQLIGNWVCWDSHGDYPDQMTLNDDGTGMADGTSCNWTEEDGILTLSLSRLGSHSYEYEFKNSTLFLDGYGYDKK